MAGGGLLDDLARSLAEPMPRRRALRLLAAAVAATAVPGIGARAGRAAKPNNCPGTQCSYPNGGCASNLKPCDGGGCCAKTDTCCGAGGQGPGGCCHEGTVCKDGACLAPICKTHHVRGESREYNPATQCCTEAAGIQQKYPIYDFVVCEKTAVPRKDYKPALTGCATKGLPETSGKAVFTFACNAFDYCYGECNHPQQECNNRFLTDLVNACRKGYPSGKGAAFKACVETSGLGHSRATGALFGISYKEAQSQACQCCA